MWSRCPGLQLWATVFVITATASHADRLEHALHPGHSLHRQLLRFGSESAWYSLKHLKPNTGYEVRVSYPATVPSKVTLQLITANASQAEARHSCQCRRHLLDTEKLIFYTDDKGTYQGQEAVVQMEAEATGIHRDGPAAKPEYFLFNIGLAELVLGIPADAFPVVLMVVIVIMAVLLLLPWWVESAVPAMLRFIAVGRDADHCSHTS